MADKGNNMVRNIIDCALIILVIFFGYHYFAAPDNAQKATSSVDRPKERFEEANEMNKQDSGKTKIPQEMLDVMKN